MHGQKNIKSFRSDLELSVMFSDVQSAPLTVSTTAPMD